MTLVDGPLTQSRQWPEGQGRRWAPNKVRASGTAFSAPPALPDRNSPATPDQDRIHTGPQERQIDRQKQEAQRQHPDPEKRQDRQKAAENEENPKRNSDKTPAIVLQRPDPPVQRWVQFLDRLELPAKTALFATHVPAPPRPLHTQHLVRHGPIFNLSQRGRQRHLLGYCHPDTAFRRIM